MKIFTLKIIISLAFGVLLSSCNTAKMDAEANAIRNAKIAVEPTGNFYYGRRYYIPGTRFWGYLREPRQPWSTAKLVVIDETNMRQPDRFPEYGNGNQKHGFDKNFEYKIYGKFTGQRIYDPNTDLVLPAFRLTNYQLVNSNPGFLFRRSENYSENEVSLRPDPNREINKNDPPLEYFERKSR